MHRFVLAVSCALLAACSADRGLPPPFTPAPGGGLLHVSHETAFRWSGGWRVRTWKPWVWTEASQDGRIYGFLEGDRAEGADVQIPHADLHLDPAVGRVWLAQIRPLALRHQPGATENTLTVHPGPEATEDGRWISQPVLPLVPWVQVVEGGRRARIGLSTEDGRKVFQLMLPPAAVQRFERGLAAALAAAEQAETLGTAAADGPKRTPSEQAAESGTDDPR